MGAGVQITYCPGDRKSSLPVKQYGSASAKLSVWSELAEVTQNIMLDPRTVAVLGKNISLVNYLHISDQYSGARQPEQSVHGSHNIPVGCKYVKKRCLEVSLL